MPDAQQAVDRAVGRGASIMRPVYDVPVGAGVGARLADPTGSHFNDIAFWIVNQLKCKLLTGMRPFCIVPFRHAPTSG
ncbi:Predicted enzyme related to lactoylglutathione lyase [Nocardia brasiliensis]|nr:Predicted enzyme related to lactoylglutathione lyase [Nocardia brasiliensis]